MLWTGGASVGDGADVQPQELLGRGGYGQVHRSLIAGKQVATKAFASKSCAMREVAVAASFEPHPNIIRLLDVHIQGKMVYLVYPLYPGTLAILTRAPSRSLEPEELFHIAKCLLGGLRRLHEAGVIHTDLKPSNILADGPRAGAGFAAVGPDWADAPACRLSADGKIAGNTCSCYWGSGLCNARAAEPAMPSHPEQRRIVTSSNAWVQVIGTLFSRSEFQLPRRHLVVGLCFIRAGA